tara:strand:+ start:839 stop:1048 length:210 start_codon:yes stop_codon:yes gene_type:complete
MLYIQDNINKKIYKVKQVCTSKPKSKECKIAWDDLERFSEGYGVHTENINKYKIIIEFQNEESSEFYDI